MKEKPKRYGGIWTADQLRDLYQSDKTMNDLLDTIDELAATLAGALDVLNPNNSPLRPSALEEFKTRARKLIDEVTQ